VKVSFSHLHVHNFFRVERDGREGSGKGIGCSLKQIFWMVSLGTGGLTWHVPALCRCMCYEVEASRDRPQITWKEVRVVDNS